MSKGQNLEESKKKLQQAKCRDGAVLDAFYLIGFAVFQCVEYHWTTKVRQ
jgi:hypothetical protein